MNRGRHPRERLSFDINITSYCTLALHFLRISSIGITGVWSSPAGPLLRESRYTRGMASGASDEHHNGPSIIRALIPATDSAKCGLIQET